MGPSKPRTMTGRDRRRSRRTTSKEDPSKDFSAPLARSNNLSKRGTRNFADTDDFPCHRFASWAPGMEQPPQHYLYQDLQGAGYVSATGAIPDQAACSHDGHKTILRHWLTCDFSARIHARVGQDCAARSASEIHIMLA